MISTKTVRLQAEYSGKGPTEAKTYIVEDLVVVLEESFTRARGDRAHPPPLPTTGDRAKVRVFLSETNVEHDVSVETFLLADERIDMTGFEDA